MIKGVGGWTFRHVDMAAAAEMIEKINAVRPATEPLPLPKPSMLVLAAPAHTRKAQALSAMLVETATRLQVQVRVQVGDEDEEVPSEIWKFPADVVAGLMRAPALIKFMDAEAQTFTLVQSAFQAIHDLVPSRTLRHVFLGWQKCLSSLPSSSFFCCPKDVGAFSPDGEVDKFHRKDGSCRSIHCRVNPLRITALFLKLLRASSLLPNHPSLSELFLSSQHPPLYLARPSSSSCPPTKPSREEIANFLESFEISSKHDDCEEDEEDEEDEEEKKAWQPFLTLLRM